MRANGNFSDANLERLQSVSRPVITTCRSVCFAKLSYNCFHP